MNKSLKAYLKIESIIFLREPLQVFFSFFFPIVMFAIFASAYGGNTQESSSYFEKYIPGYFTIIIYIISMFMIGYQMVMDKDGGIYKRLKATPFSLYSIYIAMIIKSVVLCTIGGVEIILVAKFFYGATLTNHWLQFLFAFFIGNVMAVASGFAIFALCKSAKVALTVIIISFYPFVMLADNTFPLSMMPTAIQKIAPIIDPLYHLNRIMQGAWCGTLTKDGVSFIYVTVFTVALFLISCCYDKNVDNF